MANGLYARARVLAVLSLAVVSMALCKPVRTTVRRKPSYSSRRVSAVTSVVGVQLIPRSDFSLAGHVDGTKVD